MYYGTEFFSRCQNPVANIVCLGGNNDPFLLGSCGVDHSEVPSIVELRYQRSGVLFPEGLSVHDCLNDGRVIPLFVVVVSVH